MALRHLALNALFLDPSASGGPETYLRGLAPALAQALPDTRLSVFTTRAGGRALAADGWEDWTTLRSLPADEGQRVRRQVTEQALLPLAARRARADVLHSLASIGPIRVPLTHVVTVHDVTFFHEQTFGRVTTFGMRKIVRGTAHHADGLLSGTAAARDDVCATLALDVAEMAVVHHGAGRMTRPTPSDPVALASRLELGDGPVVLCVAAKRPHKNQELLVRAMAHLAEDVVLVLAGHPEAYDARLRALAASIGVAGRVRFVDYVPDEELEALWRRADVAAFPTRGEGFGLPVIEALARGLPVACSDIPVLREVSGGHARFFGTDDPAGAAHAIRAALADGRADASARAAWAAGFTWERAAAQTIEVYERALAHRRGRTT